MNKKIQIEKLKLHKHTLSGIDDAKMMSTMGGYRPYTGALDCASEDAECTTYPAVCCAMTPSMY